MHMLQEKPNELCNMMAHGIHGHWETQLLACLLQEGETPLCPHKYCPSTTTKQVLPIRNAMHPLGHIGGTADALAVQ